MSEIKHYQSKDCIHFGFCKFENEPTCPEECGLFLRRGTIRNNALADAVAAVEKTNVCKFLKCSNFESNDKCFLENNPEFFASCEKIGHFEDAIKAAIAAIEKLKEEK